MFGKQLLKERLLFLLLLFQLILALRIDNREEPKITLSEYINNSLHLTRKYARILSRGHLLFREAKTASFDQGTYKVQGQVSEHIFPPEGSYGAHYHTNHFSQHGSFTNLAIFSEIPQFWLGNIRSRDMFRSIARERKYLMDYNDK